MAKKKANPAKKVAKQPSNPAPRQKALPGMQDRRVTVLENAALRYADVRDSRMGWTKLEVEAKKKVQDLMHEQGRTHYAHGNIEIDLVPEDEHVRVRIHDRETSVDEPANPEPIDEVPELPDEEPDDEPPPKAADSPEEL